MRERDRAGQDGFVAKKSFEFLRKFQRGAKSAGRFLFQALEADGFQVTRDAGIQLAGRDRFPFAYGHQRCLDGRSDERRMPGQQVVEDRSEPVEVRGGTDAIRFAVRLFGRHEVRRAQSFPGPCEVRILRQDFREAEVGDPGFVGRVDEHVRRFEIAVEDAPGMGGSFRLPVFAA